MGIQRSVFINIISMLLHIDKYRFEEYTTNKSNKLDLKEGILCKTMPLMRKYSRLFVM